MYLSLHLKQNWIAARFRNGIMGLEPILSRDSQVLEELQELKTQPGKVKRGTKPEGDESVPSSGGSLKNALPCSEARVGYPTGSSDPCL